MLFRILDSKKGALFKKRRVLLSLFERALEYCDVTLQEIILAKDFQTWEEMVIYETFQPNELYGNGILIRYFHQLGFEQFPMVYPHGISSSDGVWSSELDCKYPIVVYSELHKKRVSKAFELSMLNASVVIESKHPILYIPSKGPSESQTGLYFPSHSSNAFPVVFDLE